MVRMDIKRTDFYNELSEEQQKEFFYVKRSHFIPCVDNIYYTCFIEGDYYDNEYLKPLLNTLEELKLQAVQCHSHVPFGGFFVEPEGGSFPVDVLSHEEPKESKDGFLSVAPTGFNIYKYRISIPDLYDIFVLDYLPNDDTPRILVQIRAFGLWLHGADKMVLDSFETVNLILSDYGLNVDKIRENRIDYCYHTNAVQNPNKFFTNKYMETNMETSLKKYNVVGRIEKVNKKNKFSLEYVSFGQRKSNNVFVRIYDKALEVVELGYKGFFFDLWYSNNIISFYDKYCYEFAYTQKDFFVAMEKAKMHFYLEYGTDNFIKGEYKIALSSHKTTYEELRNLTSGVMPDITSVINVEFMTKRKFYYYSDNMIDNILDIDNDLDVNDRGVFPAPLKRLFKILDNKALFLNHLTSKTLCFKKNENDYVDWWKRLRNVKLDGLKHDMPLLREYNQNLDEQKVKVNFVNSVATASVYNDNVNTEFIDDVSDIMSNLNDNELVGFEAVILDQKAIDEWKKSIPSFDPYKSPSFLRFTSLAIGNYLTKKKRKEIYLKNRKKNKKSAM